MHVPFNVPLVLGTELEHVQDAISSKKLAEGKYANLCRQWFVDHVGCKEAVLTPSCTSALEMAMILLDLQPGDEVILPSYTFTSSATSIVMSQGTPVFVDVEPGTLNMNPELIEQAITDKTKAIMPVHYAGKACNMEAINEIANANDIFVIPDAAQSLGSKCNTKPVPAFGHMSCISFHETKNTTCGEGGVLCIQDEKFVERAKIVRDKGTNRAQFFEGMVDKYSWKDKGSSFLVSELQAAYLYAQLLQLETITQKRLEIWNQYHKAFAPLEQKELLERPGYEASTHNGHLYYILLPNREKRSELQAYLKEKNIHAVMHYVSLHTSEAGMKFGKVGSSMDVTDSISGRLLRLPMFFGMTQEQQEAVIQAVNSYFNL